MTDNQSSREPLLSRAQVIRLGRLLHMKYKPSEIAEVLEVNVDTVRRSYLIAGCPHERDEQGRIWIVGTSFKAWAEDVLNKRKRKSLNPMAIDEAWCFKCNKRVKISSPTVKSVNRYLELLQSYCPDCGTRTNRARAKTGER